MRLLHKDNPKADEVKVWMKVGDLELKRFFNTNGKLFKESNLKERWDTLSEGELLEILESDWLYHKRPVLIGDGFVLTGFKQKEWEEKYEKMIEA